MMHHFPLTIYDRYDEPFVPVRSFTTDEAYVGTQKFWVLIQADFNGCEWIYVEGVDVPLGTREFP